MGPIHTFRTSLRWTGDRGRGTSDYRAYGREHLIHAPDKPEIAGSSAPVYRGDAARWNPEELLVASISSCHLLWYLHLCAVRGVVVVGYQDDAEGTMQVAADGSGRFTEVVLRPRVTIARGEANLALELHGEAHRMCFVANSLNFPVRHEPTVTVAPSEGPPKREGAAEPREDKAK